MIRPLLPASTYGWSSVRPDFTGANFLLYLGAFVTLASSYGLLEAFSAGEAFLVSTLEIVALLALAAVMYYARRPISGGLLSFVVAAISAAWAVSLFDWLGWWPATSDFFHAEFQGAHLLVELIVLAISVVLLAATRFSLIGLVVALALWYLIADNGAALFDSLDGDKQAGLAFASGLLLMGAGALLDDTVWRPPSFWLHLVGLASFYAGLLQLWSDSDWGWAGVAAVSLFATLVGTAIDRPAYAVFGGLGLLAAMGHFINDWVGDLFGFSLSDLTPTSQWRPWLAYAALGLFLMLLGMLISLGERQGWRRFLVRARPVAADPLVTAAEAELAEDLSHPAAAEPVEGVVDVEAGIEPGIEAGVEPGPDDLTDESLRR